MLVDNVVVKLKDVLVEGRVDGYTNIMKIEPNKAIVIDAYVLFEVSFNSESDEFYPTEIKQQEQCEIAYLTKTTIDKIEKNLPKKSFNVPILDIYFQVKQTEKGYEVIMSDPDGNETIITQNQVKVNYPNVDEIYPDKPPLKTVRVDVKHLEKLLKVLKKLKMEYVDISIYENNNVIGIKSQNYDNNELVGLIALMKRYE